MVGTETYTRNSDGSYSSSAGPATVVHLAPNGEIWSGGAPTGFRDIGFGVQLASQPWTSPFAPATPQPYKGSPMTGRGGYAGITPQPLAPHSDIGFSIGLAVYPWMLLVAFACAMLVSAPVSLLPPGLHLGAIYGAAAFFFSIWAYRQAMTFLPTALVLAGASTLIAAGFAAALTDSASVEASYNVLLSGAGLSAVASLVPLNVWVVSAAAISLSAHFAYWRYRWRHRRANGWLFSTAPTKTMEDIVALALASIGAGGFFALINWARAAI